MQLELTLWRDAFMSRLAPSHYIEALFNRVPDIVLVIKDYLGRYVAISEACASRCGLKNAHEAIGKTAFDLFPEPMAERYTEQDQYLYRTGKPVIDSLDLTVYRDGSAGWCLSNKEPLTDLDGKVVGLIGISKDLIEPSQAGLIDADFADVIDYIRGNYVRPLQLEELAGRARLSPAQFERRMKKIFHLSSSQYLIKTRIDHAARLLIESSIPIADVAQQSGFSDQSALSRQFRQMTNYTPRQYRQLRGRMVDTH